MELSTAATVALYVVLFFVLLFAVITVAFLGAIAFGLRELNKVANRALNKVDPILAKVNDTLTTAQRVTMNVGEKADTVLSRGEQITDDLAVKISATATVVESSVTKPLINLSSPDCRRL